KRFELDAEQVEAILELKLYKLARLEILVIQKEAREKRAEAARLAGVLKDAKKRWAVVQDELAQVKAKYADPRRTKLGGGGDDVEYSEEAFIADEDAHVVLTRDGWVKRVREIKDPSTTRLREGDEVMAVLAGSLKSNLVFFSNVGAAYVTRFNDVPASTGYGDPIQKLFKFDDGERVVGGLSLDPRLPRPELLIGVSKRGYGLRFPLAAHLEASTRTGRRYARPGEGDELIGVVPVGNRDLLAVVTEHARALVTRANEINELAGPGRGVTVIKVEPDDRVLAFLCTSDREARLELETSKGKKLVLSPTRYEVSARGGRGREMARKETLKLLAAPLRWTPLPEDEKEER
ncbi:MAG TPA: DNA gyrase C-terminal beta-propeller domain-containing protein, partial [Myxococcaceae bacterium]|nr:DNA gyrase C-terminal beta-propeller domain-containing protein [Myxococcaceae bacterium]